MFNWLFNWFKREKPPASFSPTTRRISISELEAALDNEENIAIEIMPDGQIRARNAVNSLEIGKKPLTMREDLGGEYARA